MTTRRAPEVAVGRLGINYIRAIVERNQCIFNEIHQENDIGNDAYIEFIESGEATGCCIAVQIKSGNSFAPNSTYFAFSSDRDHLEYWSSHILPVAVIIYHPDTDHAAWLDLTKHLREESRRVEHGPYAIHVPRSNEFSDRTFNNFKAHFLNYRREYSAAPNFGQALEMFSDVEQTERCRDGMKALFSFHRNREATWYYVCASFRLFRRHELLRPLVVLLSHLPGHGDIFWHGGNIIDEGIRRSALKYLAKFFGREEVLALLQAVDDGWYERGSIGQCVDAIVGRIAGRDQILDSISRSTSEPLVLRFRALLLLVSYIQMHPKNAKRDCLRRIERFRRQNPGSEWDEALADIQATIKHFGYIGFY